MLVSPRIAGLREHNGEVAGEAMWPAIIDRATHDRLVGLLGDRSRRGDNFGRPPGDPPGGLVYCASCGGKMTTAIAVRQGRGYCCRKDENPICPARVRIVAEPLEAYVEGYVIDQLGGTRRPSTSRSQTTTGCRGSGKSPTRCGACKSRRTRRSE